MYEKSLTLRLNEGDFMSLAKIISGLVLVFGFAAGADMPSTHGMLLFGNDVTYASHLPMFHSPHDYQLILQLNLQNAPRALTVESYLLAKQGAETLFTLVPEVMDLTEVIEGKKTSFKANIFSGHFERGGKDLGTVIVTVEKIVYSKKLQPTQSGQSQFLVFGQEGDYYAAHLIQGKPSYDGIYGVEGILPPPCNLRLCLPKLITFMATAGGSESNPALAGEKLTTDSGESLTLSKSIYVEAGELAH